MWSERLLVAVLVVAVHWSSAHDEAAGTVTSCPVVGRDVWEARPPVIAPQNMTLPVPYVVIHHSYIPAACTTREACLRAMKAMQNMHQTKNRWNDIGYNFAVGSTGEVYEGRGWDVVGAHAPKYNFMSIGVCFIGDYRTDAPSAPMLEAVQQLILCGIERGSVHVNYTLVGHRQVRATECPGGALFHEIQRWLHWKPIRDIQPRVPTTSTTPFSDTSATSTTPLYDTSTTSPSENALHLPDTTPTTNNTTTEISNNVVDQSVSTNNSANQ